MQYNIQLVQEPNQILSFGIAEGIIRLQLRTTDSGLYADLFLNDKPVFLGKKCCNLMPLVLKQNIITGNLFFKDTIENEDPNYTEFNTRFQLIYDTEYTII